MKKLSIMQNRINDEVITTIRQPLQNVVFKTSADRTKLVVECENGQTFVCPIDKGIILHCAPYIEAKP